MIDCHVQEVSKAVSTRTRSHARAEKPDDGDTLTSPPRLGEPDTAAAGKEAAPKAKAKAKRGRSEPGLKADSSSRRDPKRLRKSRQ